jgi:hypothetical protein
VNKEDMILISVDDHIVEPPDMFKNHLAKKYQDEAPRLVHNPDGSVVGRLKTPGHHPTNMCFGDDDWKTFYITMIGSVVSIRLNTAGVPSLH